MTRKISKVLMSVALWAVSVGTALGAIETVDGIEWAYTINNGKASLGTVAGGLSSGTAVSRTRSGELVIPSTLGGCPVTSIGYRAFYECSGLTSVTIPEGVTYIDSYAFYGCSGLTSVTIPLSVKNIGYAAFAGCSGLMTVTIPEGVTSIGDLAFEGCRGLTSVTIPSGVTNIGERTFLGCSGLKSVTIPEGVTSIGDQAFWDCGGLESVTIPSSVTSIGHEAFRECSGLKSVTISIGLMSIGRYAFDGCSGLESVTIPEGVMSIGSYAFSRCSGLKSVVIPSSVTSIGDDAFRGCGGLMSFSVDVSNPNYASLNGLLCSKGGEELIAGINGDVEIPVTVTSIDEYAFWGCGELTSLTIPSSVTHIGYGAFSDCSGLKSVVIPSCVTSLSSTFPSSYSIQDVTLLEGVTSIGYRAFYGFSELMSVTIPSSVTSIGDEAFSGCSGLTSLTIPSGVKSIGRYAFERCSGLTAVTISSSVTNIGEGVFLRCSGLKSVTIPSSVTSIGSGAFEFCSGLASVTIPSGVTSIGSSAFYGCSGLTTVTIPSSVTSIGDRAFVLCSGLTTVTIPSSVTSIGSSAFYGCSGLTSVTIPSSVTSLSSTFPSAYKSIKEVTILEDMTRIDCDAFGDCCGLTSFSVDVNNPKYASINGLLCSKDGKELIAGINGDIEIPLSVTSIGDCAFCGRSGLTAVTISSSVTSIGDYAFSGCSGLMSVTIPSSVTSIGYKAFSGCSGLMSVSIPLSVTSIGYGAFSDCDSIRTAIVPGRACGINFSSVTDLVISEETTSISSSAFKNCSNLKIVTIPSSVTRIEDYAFKGCYLETICVGEGKVEGTRRMLENSDSGLDFENVCFVEADVNEIAAGSKVVVAFKSYEGSIVALVRNRNEPIGPLPSPPTLTGCSFDGWFTAEAGGSRISETTIAEGNVRFYAHWSMTDCGTISSEGVQLWEGGPYWAEQNLGASRPEEYGYYFKWADAVGYSYEGGEIEVSGTDYSVGMPLSGYWVSSEGVRMSSSPFTRSNSLDSKSATQLESGGYVSVSDGKITDAHDAARVQWGAPWRIPTKEENEELLDKCTLATVSRNGVLGRLVVGRGNYAAKSIFIPFAGYVDGSSAFAVGALSVRWASTFRVDGYTWYHCNYWHNIDDYERWWRKHGEVAGQVWQGSSIRAVRDAKIGNTATVSFSANGGVVHPETREVTMGQPLGELPTPTRTGCVFAGWFTEPNAGREVTAQTVVTGNVTYYAHWKYAAPGQETGAGLTFTTGGSAAWIVAETSHDGNGAARSGSIGNSQSSWLQTTVVGPCRLSFWWKVSSESGYDKLHWYLDGVEQGDPISGEKGWARVTTELPAGNHVVKWCYTKDGSTSNGQDCAWVDQVEVESLPVVVTFDANGGTPPSSRTVDAGNPLGTLPTAAREGYEFLGWFTAAVGGTQVTAASVVTADVTFYAQWKSNSWSVVPGEKVTIDTRLVGYTVSGLPTGLAYGKTTGKITGAATKPGEYVVKFTKSGAETEEMTIVVTAVPKITVEMAGVNAQSDTNGCKVTGAKEYLVGTKATLTATVPTGTMFEGWFKDDQPWPDEATHLNKSVTYVMGKEDVALVAKFKKERMSVACTWLSEGVFTAGVAAGVGDGILLDDYVKTESGIKSISVAKLPSGMSYNSTKRIITGFPTKAGTYNVEITVTANSGSVEKQTIPLAVEALPAWAVGNFAGTVTCADGTHGTASFAVSAAGAISSGKLLEHGSNWTFTANSFATTSVARGLDQDYVVLADAKCGKETRTVELHVTGCAAEGVAESAALAAGELDGVAGLELWRNVWKDADAKGIVAGIAGKYTYFLADDTALPLNLTSAGVLSGKVNVPVRGNASVSFSTTVFASSNGVEAAFYVAPDAKKGYGEIYERFTLVPESGVKEPGIAHRAPGVVAVPEPYPGDSGNGTVSVSPAGGQVDAGKTVMVTAKPDSKSVFVKWRYEVGGETLYSEMSKLTLTMDGEHDVFASAIFRSKGSFLEPVVAVETSEQAKFAALELGVKFSAFVTVTDVENMKPVKWSASNLPSGLKINAETGEISGVATAVNSKPVVITATSVADSKKKTTFTLDIGVQDGKPAALPETAVGTFTGFVNNGTDNLGTFTFTSSEKGALSAKVIDAKGTVSFSGSGFAWSKDGRYGVNLETKKGETLTLTLDSGAGWDKDQLTGTCKTATGLLLNVTSQRNAFSKAWYFVATGDETTGWTLAFTKDAKAAALTVTLKADGTTSIAGTLNGTMDAKGKPVAFKVSASGVANAGMMREGAMAADFAPVLTVNKVKTVLAIRTNLWFDRKNDHDTGVGEARFVK